MFDFFKKKNKGLEVEAAVDGELIPITVEEAERIGTSVTVIWL